MPSSDEAPLHRGFLLQPTYRIEGSQPVIHLYGVSESGGSFLIRDTRERPHFWIDAAEIEPARARGATIVPETPARVHLAGQSVVRVEVALPQDVPPLRDRLHAAGIACHEADLRFPYRYLIDRGIRASIDIRGPSRFGKHVDRIFDDPEVHPADWVPRLRVLSLDIETDPQGRRLLSVALSGCGADEVLLLTRPGQSCPRPAVGCPSERDLIGALLERVRELDPDVLTGWNVADFDLTVLARVADRVGTPLVLGRSPEPLRLRPDRSMRGGPRASIPGRLVLDGIHLLRSAFVRLDRYSLHDASMEILGRGKLMHGPQRAADILRAFHEDRDRFVAYNLEDARLVLEILDRLHLVELAVERSRLTGLPPDRVGASIAAFDFRYLSELARRRIVAPSVGAGEPFDVATSGGHVLDPVAGLYHNVLVFDFKSLYPSIIRTFQIDPLGRLLDPRPEDDAIVAPNGAAFRRAPGILPGLLDQLVPRREAARAAGDGVASQAIKILMNSFYGVLGTPACRFASPALANAITSFGREILLWSKARIEATGHRVLYGDTDSLFVETGVGDPGEARRLGQRLAAEVNRDLADHIERSWRVPSRLELQFDRLYLRLLLPAVRHGILGARKRYAGLVEDGGAQHVVFTGMEVVRRDWTDLARGVQRELFERLFHDRPVDEYVRQVVIDLRAGRLDDLLVYRKSLRKDLADYTASAPPHVAAARKMSAPVGSIVGYVMTREGPEPEGERRAAIDHEHYVDKQVRAVAEPILTLIGLEFDRVIGDDRQSKLF